MNITNTEELKMIHDALEYFKLSLLKSQTDLSAVNTMLMEGIQNRIEQTLKAIEYK